MDQDSHTVNITHNILAMMKGVTLKQLVKLTSMTQKAQTIQERSRDHNDNIIIAFLFDVWAHTDISRDTNTQREVMRLVFCLLALQTSIISQSWVHQLTPTVSQYIIGGILPMSSKLAKTLFNVLKRSTLYFKMVSSLKKSSLKMLVQLE